MELVQVHQEALEAAREATQSALARSNGRDCCGFSWVTCHEKGTSKLIREMKKLGFSKSYGGGYALWNPSGSATQELTAKEAGADAYVAVFLKYFPDVNMYSGSRMD